MKRVLFLLTFLSAAIFPSAASSYGVGSLHGEFSVGSLGGAARGLKHLPEDILNQGELNKYNKENSIGSYDLRMLHNTFIPFSVIFGVYNMICYN